MSYPFRHQPLKALYVLVSVLTILACIPFWVLANAPPPWRPRRSWSLKRALIVQITRTGLGITFYGIGPPPEAPLETHARNAGALGFVWVEPVPDEFVVGEVKAIADTNGVRPVRTGGFWYGPRGPQGEAGQRAAPGETVLYHFHGGAHVMGSSHPHVAPSPEMYKGLLEHVGPNTRLFGLEYRLSSAAPFVGANPFPAALLDALAGYRYLVQDLGFDPNRVILSGDSAGGGLAFNLARYLVLANLPGLPVPGGLLLLSPTCDWAGTHRGPDSAVQRNLRSDYVEAVMECGYTPRALLGKLPAEAVSRSVWISPGSELAEWKPGMFAGLPRTMILSGGAEYTLDGMRVVRNRLQEDIGEANVAYVGLPDTAHDVLLMSWHEPERTDGLKKVGRWVHEVVDGKS